MNRKVSIIVPIYNVEEYLAECLESLVHQTYENIEIILVNDGSTDNSLKICEEYRKNYPHVYLYSKKKGGLSDARNYGITKATGDYYSFVDSDDYISLDMIQHLYNNLVEYDADISCCNINMVYDNNSELKHPKKDNILVLSPEEAIKDTLYNINIDYASWNKLYKKNLFDSIRFPKGKIYEDMFIMHELFNNSKRIVYSSDSKYYYRQRNNSITKSKFSKKNFDLMDAYEVILNFVLANYPNLADDVKYIYTLQKLNLIRGIFISDSTKEYKNYISEIRKGISFTDLKKIKNNRIKYLYLRYLPCPILKLVFNSKGN